jgi:hypothetical protein
MALKVFKKKKYCVNCAMQRNNIQTKNSEWQVQTEQKQNTKKLQGFFSRAWCHVTKYLDPNISKEWSTTIFKGQ